MLAKIKDAKKIRATLAAQNQLDGPDDVCHILLYCRLHLVGYYGIRSTLQDWLLYLQTMLDATVRINEDFGETVLANSQQHMKHTTYNDGQAGNDK